MNRKTRWAASLFFLTVLSCGSPVSENTEETGTLDPDEATGPYPGFVGGDVKGETNFAALINNFSQGKPAAPNWAGFFWPYTSNGIASGAHGGGSASGGGPSPAGKYDAARGGTTRAQEWEVKHHGAGVPKVQAWWGHCNGWCVSAALFPEPREPVVVNGITFGVGDLKGLLAEVGMSASADFFGNRVDAWNGHQQWRWDDTVPGQYFLVLTNYMGKLKQSVLIDRYTGDQVWNQPLAGYQIQYPTRADYLGVDPAHPGVYRVNVRSTLWWYNDSGVPAHVLTPPFEFKDAIDPGTGVEVIQHRDMAMELWLDGPITFDENGKITQSGNVIVTRQDEHFIGGTWKMGSYNVDAHPDYMWVPYSIVKPDPNDDYANPHVDIEWIKAHLLVPGGRDDPSVRPGPITPAPSPLPQPSSSPSVLPTEIPAPIPIPTVIPRPSGIPLPIPSPRIDSE